MSKLIFIYMVLAEDNCLEERKDRNNRKHVKRLLLKIILNIAVGQWAGFEVDEGESQKRMNLWSGIVFKLP